MLSSPAISSLVPLLIFTFLTNIVTTSGVVARESKLRVLPLPTHSTTGDTVLCLSSDFTVTYDSTLQTHAPQDLQDAAKRTIESIWQSRHEYLSPTRGHEYFKASTNSSQAQEKASGCEVYLGNLVLHLESSQKDISSIFEQAIKPAEDRPALEAYTLSVPLSGPARITSSSTLGLYRGLTTFQQLFYHLPTETSKSGTLNLPLSKPDSLSSADQQLPLNSPGQAEDQRQSWESSKIEEEGKQYAPFAPYEIDDKPAFGWRAVLLDTSRNYFGVEAILKMLDTMSLVKLNVFHWHIVDSNSWPLVLSDFPELAANGAYSFRETYTENQVKEIIRYAGERGIDVVLEIDTPGHTAIIAESHPEYIACYQKTPYVDFAHQPPAGQLRFADPDVVAWTKRLFESVMGLTRGGYFGTGGDELNVRCMMGDEPTTRILDERQWTLDDALDKFTKETHGAILEAGKTPVVWQEMVLEHGTMPSVSPSTVVDIWVNSADARRVLDRGFRIIHAAADYFYLDCGQGGWITQEGGGNSWCDPFKTWMHIYSFDPYKDVEEEQRKLVLGGQTSLWAEQTDETNFEGVLWPRAAALAEVFWTGAGPNGYPRSSVEALPRMHDVRYRMVDRGVKAVPLQPHWCALRPGVCVLGA